jgi:hypothetical protein
MRIHADPDPLHWRLYMRRTYTAIEVVFSDDLLYSFRGWPDERSCVQVVKLQQQQKPD